LDGIFERAGTRPASKACKSTLLGSAAAIAAEDGSAEVDIAMGAFPFPGMSFAGGDLKVSLLVMEEKSFAV
jgi:hypothetical protein